MSWIPLCCAESAADLYSVDRDGETAHRWLVTPDREDITMTLGFEDLRSRGMKPVVRKYIPFTLTKSREYRPRHSRSYDRHTSIGGRKVVTGELTGLPRHERWTHSSTPSQSAFST